MSERHSEDDEASERERPEQMAQAGGQSPTRKANSGTTLVTKSRAAIRIALA
jgi:hypothetical protein